MRKFLAFMLVLFSCLTFVGQAVASVSANYSDCCLQGCKGMTQCANAACQACAAPQAAPVPQGMAVPPSKELAGPLPALPFDPGLAPEPWTPPD